jgi:hypothetical protein
MLKDPSSSKKRKFKGNGAIEANTPVSSSSSIQKIERNDKDRKKSSIANAIPITIEDEDEPVVLSVKKKGKLKSVRIKESSAGFDELDDVQSFGNSKNELSDDNGVTFISEKKKNKTVIPNRVSENSKNDEEFARRLQEEEYSVYQSASYRERSVYLQNIIGPNSIHSLIF